MFPADPQAVRQALRAVFDSTLTDWLCSESRDEAQLVLAEALNNIVEHAYAESTGEIEVLVTASDLGIICHIADAGRPMPDAVLPAGKVLACSMPRPVDHESLPEGGFGWPLIRALSQDLAYRRVDGRNLLSFRIAAKQQAC